MSSTTVFARLLLALLILAELPFCVDNSQAAGGGGLDARQIFQDEGVGNEQSEVEKPQKDIERKIYILSQNIDVLKGILSSVQAKIDVLCPGPPRSCATENAAISGQIITQTGQRTAVEARFDDVDYKMADALERLAALEANVNSWQAEVRVTVLAIKDLKRSAEQAARLAMEASLAMETRMRLDDLKDNTESHLSGADDGKIIEQHNLVTPPALLTDNDCNHYYLLHDNVMRESEIPESAKLPTTEERQLAGDWLIKCVEDRDLNRFYVRSSKGVLMCELLNGRWQLIRASDTAHVIVRQ